MDGPDRPPPPSVAKRLYDLFEDASSSQAAYGIAVFIVALIIISITAFVLQSLECTEEPYIPCGEEHRLFPPEVWYTLETVCTLVFTVEYVTRIAVCHVGGISRLKFATSLLNFFDLLAIVPFYIEVLMKLAGQSGGEGIQFLRLVRVARVLRLFKLSRYSVWLQLVGEGMRRSAAPVLLLLGILCMCALVLSSVLFYLEYYLARTTPEKGIGHACEADDPADCPAFTSIPETFYFSIVTMTTVGYGDLTPKTSAGRFFVSCMMFVGILLLALPVIVVGGKFQEVYAEAETQKGGLQGYVAMSVGIDRALRDADEVATAMSLGIASTEATCKASTATCREILELLQDVAPPELLNRREGRSPQLSASPPPPASPAW